MYVIAHSHIDGDVVSQGTVTVQGDRWFFLTVTWSRKTGMTLYMDGRLNARIPEGVSSLGYSVITASPNLAIGRSASSAAYFCKFSMSALVTFNQLLSPDNVMAITNFYWIRGRLSNSLPIRAR